MKLHTMLFCGTGYCIFKMFKVESAWDEHLTYYFISALLLFIVGAISFSFDADKKHLGDPDHVTTGTGIKIALAGMILGFLFKDRNPPE